MESRGSNEEPPRKRQRQNEDDTACCFFQDTHADCKAHILSFLSSQDMDSFAMCSRGCRRIRANKSIDQTRTGTIIWRPETTIAAHYRVIQARQWRTAFSGNRTSLRVQGGGPIEYNIDGCLSMMSGNPSFPFVARLDISRGPRQGQNSSSREAEETILVSFFPKLKELDISFLNEHHARDILRIANGRNRLSRLTWKGSTYSIAVSGAFLQNLRLTHLSLDASCLYLFLGNQRPKTQRDFEVEQQHEPDGKRKSIYMFMHCKRLHSLSIKGCTWSNHERGNFRFSHVNGNGSRPITQAMIIKMVRNHPTLRCLCSDLTAENTTLMKQERPDVAFVSK